MYNILVTIKSYKNYVMHYNLVHRKKAYSLKTGWEHNVTLCHTTQCIHVHLIPQQSIAKYTNFRM